MNLPTDTELVEKAEADAVARINANGIDSMRWIEAHLEALKIERESYRLLMDYRYAMKLISANEGAIEKLDAHLTTLRTRLGITE